ncbi:MAG: cohesin domain-containing protein [bacterium]|nr:cohesin domain-containing protein [bacterium]
MRTKKFVVIGGLALVINLLLVGYLYMGSNKENEVLKNVKIIRPNTRSDAPLTGPTRSSKRLATFMLESDVTSATVGSVVTVRIKLNSPELLLGADAIITYDPEMLGVKKVEAGDMFPNYPRILSEPERARIVITGVNIKQSKLDSDLFAVVEFAGLKAGSSNISFVHEIDAEKSGSTAISEAQGKNILTNVDDLEILIQ